MDEIPRATIVVVDDEESNRTSLEKILTREGYAVRHAVGGAEALVHLRAGGVNLILTDLKMPGMSGNELLQAAKSLEPDIEVIVMTAYGTVEAAVQAMKIGAYDFISKPFRRIEIVKAIRKALERQQLTLENRVLRQRLETGDAPPHRIVGTAPKIRAVLELVGQVAPSAASVLITGESGTGKELVAQAIHDLSPRRSKRYVKLNCGAIPEQLLESELFGYEPGAFTGAAGRKQGRFELADGGSLFLDEVGEMAPQAQVKLLRVLQEGEFERLGGNQTISVDVRLVAATNKDLAQLVKAGRFREDLFYRLNVIQIEIPTLKERREDIPLLAQHFLRIYARKNGRDIVGFAPETMEVLMGYDWPGNVRELENTMERAVVLCRGKRVGVEDLPPQIRSGRAETARFLTIPIGTPLKEIEMDVILETLKHAGGDKNLAANLLGINARTIYRKLEEWGGKE